MATTTGGTTYVTSTDLVADYPTASLALANRVDVVASGGPNSIKTSGYTITLADILGGNKFLYNSASPGTFTLPTSGLVDGMVVNVAQIGAGALTVSGGTIVGTTVTTAQYQSLQFVYASSGTTWYSVAPPATAPGLAIVTPTSIANSGGSASASGGAVTFSGVNSVSLNGCFTSTYENYRVVINWIGSSSSWGALRFRTAGTDNSSATYTFANWQASANSSFGISNAGDSETKALIANVNSAQYAYTVVEVADPMVAQWTRILESSTGMGGTGNSQFYGGASAYAGTTTFDGLTLFMNGGTVTGTVRVYGYKNS